MKKIKFNVPPIMLGEHNCIVKSIKKSNEELVEAGEIIMELESSSSVLEINVQDAGKILINKKEGDVVRVGDLLFFIEVVD